MKIQPRKDFDSGDIDRAIQETAIGEDIRDIESILGDLTTAQDHLSSYLRHHPTSELAHSFGPLAGLRDVLDEISGEHNRLQEKLREEI